MADYKPSVYELSERHGVDAHVVADIIIDVAALTGEQTLAVQREMIAVLERSTVHASVASEPTEADLAYEERAAASVARDVERLALGRGEIVATAEYRTVMRDLVERQTLALERSAAAHERLALATEQSRPCLARPAVTSLATE